MNVVKIPTLNGMTNLFGYGKLFKVKSEFVYNTNAFKKASDLEYAKNPILFRFRRLDEKERKSLSYLNQNMEIKDTTSTIEVRSNIKFDINDRIETKCGLKGIIQNEVIVKSFQEAYNGQANVVIQIITFG